MKHGFPPQNAKLPHQFLSNKLHQKAVNEWNSLMLWDGDLE